MSFCSTVSAGGQSEQPSDVNSSTSTGVVAAAVCDVPAPCADVQASTTASINPHNAVRMIGILSPAIRPLEQDPAERGRANHTNNQLGFEHRHAGDVGRREKRGNQTHRRGRKTHDTGGASAASNLVSPDEREKQIHE